MSSIDSFEDADSGLPKSPVNKNTVNSVDLPTNTNMYGDTLEQVDVCDQDESESTRVLTKSDSVILEPKPTSELASPASVTPSLPDRKSIQDCLKLDQQDAFFESPTKSDEEQISQLNHLSLTYNKASSNYLLQSKFNQLNDKFNEKDRNSKESISSGTENIKKTFNDIKNTVGSFSDMFAYKIDWEFWTKIVNEYEDVISNDSDHLDEMIMSGIPKEFRGIIWQLVAKLKNFQLEELYILLKSEPSVHEKSIKRDLSRTSFFTNVEQVNKGEELFNVIKAYSLFDPEVGYTQGMIFITIPLIMNMSDAECFCLLVTLMKDYKLRELFCPEMKGLHLLLYEFDRLLEIYSPILFNHQVKQGIKSSMYASQWFLTFFAYKFPLDMVLRIYDIIVTQGIESILKFAVNLMIKNETTLLSLKFDKLLGYLKDQVFNVYVNDEYVVSSKDNSGLSRRASKRFSILGSKRNSFKSASPNNSNYYKLDDFVRDSMAINLEPVELTKFENEFETIYLSEVSKGDEIEKLKAENGNLRHQIKGLETTYASLNRDHIDMVQKMVDVKIKLPELLNDNDDLRKQIEQLKTDIQNLEKKSSIPSSPLETSSGSTEALPTSLESDIQELLLENAQATEKCANLEDELEKLTQEDDALTTEFRNAKGKKWFGRW